MKVIMTGSQLKNISIILALVILISSQVDPVLRIKGSGFTAPKIKIIDLMLYDSHSPNYNRDIEPNVPAMPFISSIFMHRLVNIRKEITKKIVKIADIKHHHTLSHHVGLIGTLRDMVKIKSIEFHRYVQSAGIHKPLNEIVSVKDVSFHRTFDFRSIAKPISFYKRTRIKSIEFHRFSRSSVLKTRALRKYVKLASAHGIYHDQLIDGLYSKKNMRTVETFKLTCFKIRRFMQPVNKLTFKDLIFHRVLQVSDIRQIAEIEQGERLKILDILKLTCFQIRRNDLNCQCRKPKLISIKYHRQLITSDLSEIAEIEQGEHMKILDILKLTCFKMHRSQGSDQFDRPRLTLIKYHRLLRTSDISQIAEIEQSGLLGTLESFKFTCFQMHRNYTSCQCTMPKLISINYHRPVRYSDLSHISEIDQSQTLKVLETLKITCFKIKLKIPYCPCQKPKLMSVEYHTLIRAAGISEIIEIDQPGFVRIMEFLHLTCLKLTRAVGNCDKCFKVKLRSIEYNKLFKYSELSPIIEIDQSKSLSTIESIHFTCFKLTKSDKFCPCKGPVLIEIDFIKVLDSSKITGIQEIRPSGKLASVKLLSFTCFQLKHNSTACGCLRPVLSDIRYHRLVKYKNLNNGRQMTTIEFLRFTCFKIKFSKKYGSLYSAPRLSDVLFRRVMRFKGLSSPENISTIELLKFTCFTVTYCKGFEVPYNKPGLLDVQFHRLIKYQDLDHGRKTNTVELLRFTCFTVTYSKGFEVPYNKPELLDVQFHRLIKYQNLDHGKRRNTVELLRFTCFAVTYCKGFEVPYNKPGLLDVQFHRMIKYQDLDHDRKTNTVELLRFTCFTVTYCKGFEVPYNKPGLLDVQFHRMIKYQDLDYDRKTNTIELLRFTCFTVTYCKGFEVPYNKPGLVDVQFHKFIRYQNLDDVPEFYIVESIKLTCVGLRYIKPPLPDNDLIIKPDVPPNPNPPSPNPPAPPKPDEEESNVTQVATIVTSVVVGTLIAAGISVYAFKALTQGGALAAAAAPDFEAQVEYSNFALPDEDLVQVM